MPHPDYCTPAEACTLLGCDARTLRRWITMNKIRAGRTPGGHRRYLRADVIAVRDLMYPPTGTAEPAGRS
jgi:excisionase family DNA binding protein